MSNRKHRDNQEICARKVRELAQAGVNKHCFECSQPGVTYTDITVGCFVCTSCSGMLRGLNPPHRVKSISMTTFSQQEVEFLQNHGNEVGRRTWLCVFDPKTDGCLDTRDAQNLKEFLQDKYEKKKWHFSKSKSRREVEGPWSPGSQAPPPLQAPPPQAPNHAGPAPTRTPRTLPQLSSWDGPPSMSPADMRTDVFTARPSRSHSFRDPQIKDHYGIERQRPGSLNSALGAQSHAPSFPALPRPSAGRTVSASGGGAPFRAFPKSLSVDFGGLGGGQQHGGALGAGPSPAPNAPNAPNAPSAQDRYAALSQLDNSVFSDTSPGSAPPGGLPQYSALFGNRLSSSSSPASSPGVETVSGSQTFANFPNPFGSAPQPAPGPAPQPALSPSNPFNCPSAGDSFVSPSSSSLFPAAPSAFPHEPTANQEANGFTPFPAPESQPKVPRPMSVNPFTGIVYPSRGTSRNPFI